MAVTAAIATRGDGTAAVSRGSSTIRAMPRPTSG